MNEKINNLKAEINRRYEELKALSSQLVTMAIRFYPLPDLENPSISMILIKKNNPIGYARLEKYVELETKYQELKRELRELCQTENTKTFLVQEND